MKGLPFVSMSFEDEGGVDGRICRLVTVELLDCFADMEGWGFDNVDVVAVVVEELAIGIC